jgi:hypothetical protein
MMTDDQLRAIADRWSPPAGAPAQECTYDEAVADVRALVDEIVRVRYSGGDPQAGRLEAVRDALMYAISIICNVENPTVTQDVPWEPLRRGFLEQAYAALGPPPTGLPPRQEAPNG